MNIRQCRGNSRSDKPSFPYIVPASQVIFLAVGVLVPATGGPWLKPRNTPAMPTDRIVLTTSLDPFLDPRLRPGAVRCLGLLRSLAGHSRLLSTLTASLARQLGRCTNTVRHYRDELVDAGYICWTTDRRTGIVIVLIRSTVEPPSRRAAMGFEGGRAICCAR